MLITRKDLLDCFSQNLEWATGIDIASAWTTPNEALRKMRLRKLQNQHPDPLNIRAVVGPLDGITDPDALKALACMGQLRVRHVDGKHRRFHPKVYIFRGADRSVAWIGSANFTARGFGSNEEVLYEASGTEDVEGWFNRLWKQCAPLDECAINNYANWRKRNLPRTPKAQKFWPPVTIDHPMQLLEEVSDWKSYVEALMYCDVWWRWRSRRDKYPFSVLGEKSSYLHTISAGRKIARLPDWRNLKQRKCYILRGKDTEEGNWALLGDLKRGAAYVLNPVRMPGVGPVRMQIREQVDQVLKAGSSEIAEVAHDAMEAIRKLKHVENAYRPIGLAAATRLLTLSRPDFLVSVNGASATRLGKLFSGKPKTSASLANDYVGLLKWVYDQPWFKAGLPDDDWERKIWNCRAALIDAFVYEKSNG